MEDKHIPYFAITIHQNDRDADPNCGAGQLDLEKEDREGLSIEKPARGIANLVFALGSHSVMVG